MFFIKVVKWNLKEEMGVENMGEKINLKRVLFLLLMMLFILNISTGCSNKSSNKLKDLTLQNVSSIDYIPEFDIAETSHLDTIHFKLNSQHDQEVISKLLNWIQSSKVSGHPGGVPSSSGGSSPFIQIQCKSGRSYSIYAALYSDSNDDDLVAVFYNDASIYLISPELRQWIEDGWTKDFPPSKH
jgi:hypothetical protein